MVHRKKSLPCAMHYAIIFGSTVRDPPPFPIADTFLHSPPMVESCAAPRPRFFWREGPRMSVLPLQDNRQLSFRVLSG